MITLVLDTETTGLTKSRLLRDEHQPHVIEFAAELVDLKTGDVLHRLGHLIKPPCALPKEVVDLTHITDDMLVDKPVFADVADEIFAMIEQAPMVLAHNLSFDKEVVDIEAERLQRSIKWPIGRCTVEQSVHLAGYRLSLKRLHEELFVKPADDMHRAELDVHTLAQCATAMFAQGML